MLWFVCPSLNNFLKRTLSMISCKLCSRDLLSSLKNWQEIDLQYLWQRSISGFLEINLLLSIDVEMYTCACWHEHLGNMTSEVYTAEFRVCIPLSDLAHLAASAMCLPLCIPGCLPRSSSHSGFTQLHTHRIKIYTQMLQPRPSQ